MKKITYKQALSLIEYLAGKEECDAKMRSRHQKFAGNIFMIAHAVRGQFGSTKHACPHPKEIEKARENLKWLNKKH